MLLHQQGSQSPRLAQMPHLRMPILPSHSGRHLHSKRVLAAKEHTTGDERRMKHAIEILDKIQKPLPAVIILLGVVGFLIELMAHLLTGSTMTMAWALPGITVAIVWVGLVVADVALSMVTDGLDGGDDQLRK